MNDATALIFAENVAIALIDGCVLNAIYDVGPSDTYVEENGIGAFYNSSSSTWNIVSTPNTSYVIPETISGKTINGVYLDLISGAPIFEKPVELKNSGDPSYLTTITVTTSDLDFIFNCGFLPGTLTADFEYFDFTECGDNIEFPEEFLTNFQSIVDNNGEWAVIYVSSAVKANYADYDFIQVKE